tara:strand:+ start:140 stop:706 length:567 start_codon:yes stop_codon:yes gene_type:complete
MGSVKVETIGGFNDFIEDQRKADADQVHLVTQFDNKYEILQDGVELDDVMTLNEQNYVPRGGTQLLDAMGQTIMKMDSILAGDRTIAQSILVVLTDGQEYGSKEFTREAIFKLIENRKALGNWDFVFLGAGQDAIEQAQGFGIANSAQYSATGQGTTQAMNAVSRSITSYSMGGEAKVNLNKSKDSND